MSGSVGTRVEQPTGNNGWTISVLRKTEWPGSADAVQRRDGTTEPTLMLPSAFIFLYYETLLYTHVNDPICSHLPRPMRSLEGWHWSNRLLRYYLSMNIISDRSTNNTIIGFHIRDENKELFVGSWSVMHFPTLFITFYFSFYSNFIKLRQANKFYCFELSFHNNYTDRWKPDEKSIGSIADECLCVLKRIFSWSLTLSLHRKQERFFHCNAEFYNMQLILISCIQ